MPRGPSSCMVKRYVKPGERILVYEKMTNIYDWSTSHFLTTKDFHEIELTKKIERN